MTGGLAGRPAEMAPLRAKHPAPTLRTCGVMPAKGAILATELQSRATPSGGDAATGQDPREDDIRLERVGRTYESRGGAPVEALAAVSLRVSPGEVVAVVGPSGCGKTTLLELVCGLQPPDAGSVRCAPAVLMPQRDLLLPWLSALDNAALALRLAGLRRARAREQAAELFGELGLEGFAAARPHELSGGMRQRVAFLRTLLSGKPLLCLDEPFASLDAITRAEMQDWLTGALACNRIGSGSGAAPGPRTVLLVTHDVEEAVLLADRVAVMSPRPGRIVTELEVPMPRPRGRSDTAVIDLRAAALSALASGGTR
jgi:ABC-type nitrate/sulfonate/bicarbonate transport system ATPase subunit